MVALGLVAFGFFDCETGKQVTSIIKTAMTGATTGQGSLSGMAWGAAGSVAGLVPGGSLVVDLIHSIGSLFGAAPRGDLKKFQRTVYPYMRTLAQKSGVPVFIGWFNDIVGVKPDGSYGISVPDPRPGSYVSWGELESRLEQIQAGEPFYFARCGRSDGDCVNNPSDLQFEAHGNISAVGSVGGGGGGSFGKWFFPALLIGGVALFFVWGKK